MKYIKCPCCNSIEEIPLDAQKRPIIARLLKFDLQPAEEVRDFEAFWCNICGVFFRVRDDEFDRP